MSCSRGKASPDTHTRLRLCADSGGYCQTPDCNKKLFLPFSNSNFHIAEIAHIFSATDNGPRSRKELTDDERGDYSNLILLCPSCHSTIDKAEDYFPDTLIQDWKVNHVNRINELFNIKKFKSRQEVRNAILPLLHENRTIFQQYGPMTDERFNPESDSPRYWLKKIHEFILPNNRKILNIIDANYELLSQREMQTVETYRQHVYDFEAKHINNEELNGIQFPAELNEVFKK
jgi:hypothetical protein